MKLTTSQLRSYPPSQDEEEAYWSQTDPRESVVMNSMHTLVFFLFYFIPRLFYEYSICVVQLSASWRHLWQKSDKSTPLFYEQVEQIDTRSVKWLLTFEQVTSSVGCHMAMWIYNMIGKHWEYARLKKKCVLFSSPYINNWNIGIVLFLSST